MALKLTSISLGELVSPKNEFILIDDTKEYKLCRVRTKAEGAVLRELKNGSEIKTKKQQVCKEDDLIVAEMDARFGGYAVIPKKLDNAIVSSHYFLYQIDTNKVRPAFLNYILKLPSFFSQVQAQGSTNYAAIRPYQVLSYQVPYTSISEQDIIIERLQSVQHKIEEIRRLRLEQNKEIIQLIYSRFIDITKRLNRLPFRNVAKLMRRPVDIDLNMEYKEIGARSFGKGLFEKPSFKGSDLTWQQPYWIHSGDLVFSNIKAWEGAVAAADDSAHLKVASHRYLTYEPDNDVTSAEFLCYYFLTPEGLEILQKASPGSADRNRTLNTRFLNNILIPIPDPDIQTEFLEFKRKMEQVKKYHDTTLKELDELFPSLLDKAFKGEL